MLRPYQLDMVKQCSKAYQAGAKGIILQMATGAGKTRTASYIVGKYTTTNRQVLWLVHREELMLQASMTFSEAELDNESIISASMHLASLGYKHSLICSTSTENAIKVRHAREFGRSFIRKGGFDSTLVIASVPTLVRRLDKVPWLNPFQIIADECHLSLAETWTKVISNWPNARLLGLTATPSRLDKKPFAREQGGVYDVLIQGPKMSDLISWGNLAKYKLYTPPIKFKEIKLHKRGGDWDSSDLDDELSDPMIYGDVIKHYKEKSEGKPAIGFCPTVASAERFANAFFEAGYRAISLDGKTDDNIRRDSLAQLGRGELDVIFSVAILIEGTDVPYACTAIMLRRTESLVIYLQSIGRVLRPHPDKDYAVILDFVGNWQTHGYPDDDREWFISGEVKNKSDKEDRKYKIRTCLKCGCVHDFAPICPECGNVYLVKGRQEMKQDKEGELVEKIRAKEEIKTIQIKKKKEVSKARSLDELLIIEKTRGYKKGWAYMVHRARSARGYV